MGNTNSTVYHCASCPKEFDSSGKCDQHFRDAHVSVPTAGEINKMAREFHDAHARPLKTPQMDPNFQTFHKVSKCLFDYMFEQGLATQRICVGSVYERTNIQQSYDFDVLYVKRDPKLTAIRDNKVDGLSKLSSEYVQLKHVGWIWSDVEDARKYMDKMKGSIQKILNNKDFGDNIVKLHDHGPAFMLEVRDKNQYSASGISIDVVPTIELANGKRYVAKEGYWRISHSYEAREKMLKIDDGSKCHREVYRTCKVIIRNERNMHHITSYRLKSALFHTSDKWFKSWGRQYIGDRIIDVMEYLRSAYASGSLSDYFDHGTNLLEKTSEYTRTNTANRLDYLKKNPWKMFA